MLPAAGSSSRASSDTDIPSCPWGWEIEQSWLYLCVKIQIPAAALHSKAKMGGHHVQFHRDAPFESWQGERESSSHNNCNSKSD